MACCCGIVIVFEFAMSLLSECLEVLAQYPDEFRPEQVELLGSVGGFSGGMIWRVTTADRVLCLKRWPVQSPSEDGLRLIHAVLFHVARQGFDWLPVPCKDRLGRTFIGHKDHLWELAPWLPGKADFRHDRRPERLRAAMRALAEFHRAAATVPDEASGRVRALHARGPVPTSCLPNALSVRVRAEHAPYGTGSSPSVHERLQRVRHYAAGDLEELARCIVPDVWPGLCDRAWQAAARARVCLEPVGRLLERVSVLEVPLQPCIRDVWHDHVLFTGDRVTGLVDFGAMRVENVAGDVARLLGSLAGDDPSLWRVGLDAYCAIRPLSDAEQSLVVTFDRSGVLLAALNWVEWLYRERRQFPDAAAVAHRFDEVLRRLQFLSASPTADFAPHAGLWLPGPT